MRRVAHIGLILGPVVLVYGYATNNTLLALFGFVGTGNSLATLLNSGGIKFGEFWSDRKARIQVEEVKKRERAREDAYIQDVRSRERERAERERLRKLFESSSDD